MWLITLQCCCRLMNNAPANHGSIRDDRRVNEETPHMTRLASHLATGHIGRIGRFQTARKAIKNEFNVALLSMLQ